MDSDLASIQEARDLVAAAFEAQKQWAKATQAQVDAVCAAMAEAGFQASERLGRMASEETGYGVPAHKKLKNEFGSRVVWESIRDLKSVGVVREDPARRVYEIAWPMGVVAGLIPSTNPTSTVFAKALMAVKARDAIVFAPHPSAARCSLEAASRDGGSRRKSRGSARIDQLPAQISLPGTQELMNHKYVALILATGGSGMVKAAHSVGKPAYGVGPGNVPVYVDRTADLEKAARYIVASKAFDYSTICATEQAVIADAAHRAQAGGPDESTGSAVRYTRAGRSPPQGAFLPGWRNQPRFGGEIPVCASRYGWLRNSGRDSHPGYAAYRKSGGTNRFRGKS